LFKNKTDFDSVKRLGWLRICGNFSPSDKNKYINKQAVSRLTRHIKKTIVLINEKSINSETNLGVIAKHLN
jgi:hypothetical protein